MKIIKPTQIIDARLLSSTATETEYAAWSPATAYVVGDKVVQTSTLPTQITSGWSFTAGSATADQILGPYGGIVGDNLNENTATSVHQAYVAYSFPVSGTYKLAVLAKAGTATQIVLSVAGGAFTDTFARFAYYDLSTGATSGLSGSGAVATMTPVSDGWYLCELLYTTQVTVSANISIGLALAGASSYTGTSRYARIWYCLNDPASSSGTNGSHKVYECLVNNTAYSPASNLSGATPKWLDIASTNKYKMFDEEVGSATIVASPLTVVFTPNTSGGLAMLELTGTSASISVKDVIGGTVVYTNSKNLDGTIILDWYAYFFEGYTQLTEWVVTDIPPYPNCEITVSITSTTTAGCGVLVVGPVYDIGEVQYGVTTGITDYGIKTTDAFGRTTIVPRKYSKRIDARLHLRNSALNRVQKLLALVRSTPCVWIGSEEDYLSLLVVYGFYKDFSIEIPYPDDSYCSLQIEGLT